MPSAWNNFSFIFPALRNNHGSNRSHSRLRALSTSDSDTPSRDQHLVDLVESTFYRACERGAAPFDALRYTKNHVHDRYGLEIPAVWQHSLLDSLPASYFSSSPTSDPFGAFSRLRDALPGARHQRSQSISDTSSGYLNSPTRRAASFHSVTREHHHDAIAPDTATRPSSSSETASTDLGSRAESTTVLARSNFQQTNSHDERGPSRTTDYHSNNRSAIEVLVTVSARSERRPSDAPNLSSPDEPLNRTSPDVTIEAAPLPSDFARLRHTHDVSPPSPLPYVGEPPHMGRVSDSDVEEARCTCLQVVLDVFPDVAVQQVLALINTLVNGAGDIEVQSEIIINQLLEGLSYADEPSGISDDGKPALHLQPEQAIEPNVQPLPGPRTQAEKSSIADACSQMISGSMDYLTRDQVAAPNNQPPVCIHNARRSALEIIASPSQNPWRESPLRSVHLETNSLCRDLQPDAHIQDRSPSQSPLSAHQNDLVAPRTEAKSRVQDGQLESPVARLDSTTDLYLSRNPSGSGMPAPSRAKSTSLYRKFQEETSSGTSTLRLSATPEISDSNPDPGQTLRAVALRQSRTRTRDRTSLQTRSSDPVAQLRRDKTNTRPRDHPSTPRPHRQRHFITPQDQSPCEQVSQRRSSRRSTSPVNIEGLYEYIVPEEATYGADVPADRGCSPWTGKVRSMAEEPSPDRRFRQDPSTPQRAKGRKSTDRKH